MFLKSKENAGMNKYSFIIILVSEHDLKYMCLVDVSTHISKKENKT